MENEYKKNNNVLYAVIVVLVAIICLLFGFIIGKGDLFDKDTNEPNVENKEENNLNEFKNIDVNSTTVSSAMNLVRNKNNSKLYSACFIQYDIYSRYAENKLIGKVSIQELDSNDILQLIYENISTNEKPSKIESGETYYIDKEIFEETAKKVFGNNYNIPESGYSGCGIKISYDSNKQQYKIEEALAGDQSVITSKNTYESAKMNNDTLIVTEKVSFSYPDITTDEVKENYSKILTLEYTFKKDSNNNFYFYSIENK